MTTAGVGLTVEGGTVTDREWWEALPPDAEFLTPPGACGGVFPAANRGGLRCRPNDGEWLLDEPDPLPEGCGAVEVWAGGLVAVPLAELRTWRRFR